MASEVTFFKKLFWRIYWHTPKHEGPDVHIIIDNEWPEDPRKRVVQKACEHEWENTELKYCKKCGFSLIGCNFKVKKLMNKKFLIKKCIECDSISKIFIGLVGVKKK